ncbi:hypothetical protein JP75_10510 [Devosia riboflavina]|uniref:riboflavin kinase n=1 Tax=Devosia riboflavina TaxID=46914 RepID=A0A087M355_9HYPH|nr:riboflavin kinase [Devosia riboflavina]KFL31308.1 hypothetical protein JP75_10510 [Devosia riboflavina]
MGIRLSGCVIHGDKRGRKLGFPTANLSIAPGVELPPDGVYSCIVWLPGQTTHHGATASVGNNPTFDDVKERRVEIYIHDFDGTLYGHELNICLLTRLRDMRRFSGLDDLTGQTERDVAQSRAMLAHHALTGLLP